MALSARFEMRIHPEEDRRLDALADLTQRSRADVIRFLIRHAEPAAFGGILLATSWPQEREATRAPAAGERT